MPDAFALASSCVLISPLALALTRIVARARRTTVASIFIVVVALRRLRAVVVSALLRTVLLARGVIVPRVLIVVLRGVGVHIGVVRALVGHGGQ